MVNIVLHQSRAAQSKRCPINTSRASATVFKRHFALTSSVLATTRVVWPSSINEIPSRQSSGEPVLASQWSDHQHWAAGCLLTLQIATYSQSAFICNGRQAAAERKMQPTKRVRTSFRLRLRISASTLGSLSHPTSCVT